MRERSRHVQRTIAKQVTEIVTASGWVDEPRNYNLDTPVEVWGMPASGTVDLLEDTKPAPIVVVHIPAIGQAEPEELGGPLRSTAYDLEVHVRSDKGGLTLAICQDIYDGLTDRIIPLLNFADLDTDGDPTPVEGASLEFEYVIVDEPRDTIPVQFRRSWRMVTAIANLHYSWSPA